LENKIKKLESEIKRLVTENKKLRALSHTISTENKPTVKVPKQMQAIFEKAEKTVGNYFKSLKFTPSKGTIEINDERYVLVRASALSHEFLYTIKDLYKDRGEEEALNIGKNILFDMSHVIGMEDAQNFHRKMKLTDPISKLSAGPVHFAYAGWASVDILPESRPSPDENCYLKYHHPFSFEADSWVSANKRSKFPVCIMNAGYSSGWCEASFGIPLTAVEIECKAKGDKQCTFIMAPPHKIDSYLKQSKKQQQQGAVAIPAFLESKKIEEKLKSSLVEKEVLLKEIHHRVKNNLQIMSSLLNLQADSIKDNKAKEKYTESIGRIKSMAIIHELLYRSKNLSNIKIKDYVSELVSFIAKTYSMNNNVTVELKVKVQNEFIDIDKAIPCGIIINELLSNAFKYAFGKKDHGKIKVEFIQVKDQRFNYQLKVVDNGVGIAKKINFTNPTTLGLQLVYSLVDQIDGKLKVERKKGSSFTIQFP
jgi:two-component sensor histidine kinase/predicted hydrocarbon binding protein